LRNRKDYPEPIVNIEETRKYASDIVWSFRKKDEVKEEGTDFEKHVSNPNRRAKKTKS
jgi:deoxyribodipyrimidine photo-lyase